ncbi:ATP-binding protein [Streptomyces sp. NBC_01276]|uniref:ATP-binding protein n=1 Tax=Streptomyces sp. NBC_01276 TaxID=2903808 RepID=UPI00352D07D9
MTSVKSSASQTERSPHPRTRPHSTPVRRRLLVLAGAPGQVAKARDFTRRALREWELDGTETSEDALLLVSELVANAALHAGGCQYLALSRGDAVRVEVCDGSPELPRRRFGARPGVPGNHGLRIVDRLCDRWGSEAHAPGKVVWAEIGTSRLVAGGPVRR